MMVKTSCRGCTCFPGRYHAPEQKCSVCAAESRSQKVTNGETGLVVTDESEPVRLAYQEVSGEGSVGIVLT